MKLKRSLFGCMMVLMLTFSLILSGGYHLEALAGGGPLSLVKVSLADGTEINEDILIPVDTEIVLEFSKNVSLNPYTEDNKKCLELQKDGVEIPLNVMTATTEAEKRIIKVKSVTPLEYSAEYSLMINKDIKANSGTTLGEARILKFTTIAKTESEPTTPVSEERFVDLKDHWAKEDIELIASKNIINGIDEHHFAPELSITRAQYVALLVRALSLAPEKTAIFSDVTDDAWYAGEVGVAAKAGLIKDDTGVFRPKEYITREEMAVMSINAYKVKKSVGENVEATFTDEGQIQEEYLASVKAAKMMGIITGMPDGRFAPKDHATRAQGAVILKRLLEKMDIISVK